MTGKLTGPKWAVHNAKGAGGETLRLLGLSEKRGPGQDKDHDLFADGGADVVVQAQHLDAGGLLDQGLHGRPRGLDQMSPHLLQEVSALLAREGRDQVLFGGSQDALEPDHEKLADEVGVDVLGPPAHVLLFKAADPCTDGGFDLSLRFHNDLERARIPRQRSGTPRLIITGGEKSCQPTCFISPSLIIYKVSDD